MAKRIFDLFFAVTGLAIIWPAFLLVAALIKLDDRGPVFFHQRRVGLGGCPFSMWKFRTMLVDAEKLGLQLTIGADRRITRVGQWLRRSKLDELPQLINVVMGEMSLVGPRPEVQHYVDLYTDDDKAVLQLVPGITDPASIEYRAESEVLAATTNPEKTYIEEIMPEKIRINLEYARRASITTDFLVVLRTISRLLT